VLGLIVSLVFTGWAAVAAAKAAKIAEEATKDADRAIEIAERNANAAANQVEIAEKTAKRQLRAYLGVSKLTPVDAIGEQGLFLVRLEFKNSGQTPAYIQKCMVKSWLGKFPIYSPFEEGPPMEQFYSFDPIINPGREFEIRFKPIMDAEIDTFRSDDMAYYVYGHIEYLDVFEAKQWLDFAYRACFTTRNLPGGIAPCTKGNGGT
jgi:hypothetical protein